MPRTCHVGPPPNPVVIGAGRPLAVIGGPCLLESRGHAMEIAGALRSWCARLGLPYIFKASFDKANRSSIRSARGPGLATGLDWLGAVRHELGVPVTTDIHEAAQAAPVAEVVDLLQIPAFLCRQTDLLAAAGAAAAQRRRAVNIKKGQFLSAREMAHAVAKVVEAGCGNVLVTERGTFFGYGRLVNDFLGVADLLALPGAGAGPDGAQGPVPVCFDCTHSTQTPGSGEVTGGRPERAPALARAAVAVGVHAIFLECHEEPARAASDAGTMVRLTEVPALLESVAAIAGLPERGRWAHPSV